MYSIGIAFTDLGLGSNFLRSLVYIFSFLSRTHRQSHTERHWYKNPSVYAFKTIRHFSNGQICRRNSLV